MQGCSRNITDHRVAFRTVFQAQCILPFVKPEHFVIIRIGITGAVTADIFPRKISRSPKSIPRNLAVKCNPVGISFDKPCLLPFRILWSRNRRHLCNIPENAGIYRQRELLSIESHSKEISSPRLSPFRQIQTDPNPQNATAVRGGNVQNRLFSGRQFKLSRKEKYAGKTKDDC